jgi:hypothetical protein
MKELSLEQKVQKALDVQEISDVMGKHAYYHSVGYHLKELKDIWVKENGTYAATASFGQNNGYWVGMKRIKQFYGDFNEKNRKANLEKVSTLYPGVKNLKENEGVGNLIMLTCPQ